MPQKEERSKVCPHCDGNIPRDAALCHFCGESLFPKAQHQHSIEKHLESHYRPPYIPRETSLHRSQNETHHQPAEEGVKKEMKDSPSFTSILSLSIGGILLVFSFFLLFFSEEGILRLEWKQSLWPFYLLIALPFLYRGIRSIS